MIAPPPAAFAAAAPRTVFAGTLRSGAGESARARAVLRGEGGHRFAVLLSTTRCRGFRACPAGTLRGVWRLLPGPRDGGEAVVLSGSGTLRGAGRVRAGGRAHGTGFIASGRPSLTLTLRGAGATLVLRALGPIERGFTPVL